jgi:hypothetical protein
MPQSGVPVSPGRTHRGDQEPDTGDGRRLADRRHEPPRPVRAVPARLASIADVTAELDFTPRPRPRRTSGPVAARTAAPRTAPESAARTRTAAARTAAARTAPARTAPAGADRDRARTAPDADRIPYDRTAPATRSGDAPRSRRIALEASSKRADAAGLTTGNGIAGRRTVTIHGRPAEHYSPTTSRRRRPARRPHERDGFRPDRVAMWAVMLGFVLVLVAATSSHAATITHRAAGAHRQVARVHASTHLHASPPAVRLRAR